MNKYLRWMRRPILLMVGFYLAICLTMYFFQEFIIFHPVVLDQSHVFQFDDPFEEVWMDGKNGANINGVWFKHPDAKAVVLYLHGTGGSIEEASGVRKDFLSKGYDLFIFDYRTFGKSTGSLSEEGLYTDALAAYDFVETVFPPEKIIIYGRSLGSGLAARLAAEKSEAALILETPYYSMERAARNQYPWLPVSLLLQYRMNTAKYLPDAGCPVLVLHGTEDETIPVEDAKELAQEGLNTQIVVFPGGTHNNLNTYPEYHSQITSFLNQLNL